MLSFHLESACNDLDEIISITEHDIKDIKEAQHNVQFDRLSAKEERLNSFENRKAMIDHEISKLMTQNPEKGMSDLLSTDEQEKLDLMKTKLETLRVVNKNYAKMVVTVGAFYNTLLEQIVPTEMQGYKKVASNEASILKVRV